MSISGGVDRAIDRGAELGCTAIQIFVKNARRLFENPIPDDVIERWHQKMSGNGIVKSVLAHSGYLINLAAPDDEKWERYIDAMTDEMKRCDDLGIENIALHPGSPHDKGEEWGIKRVAEAIDRIYESGDFNVNIALETTAGTGKNIGWKFEHMRDIVSASRYEHRLRLVLDTCHIYAAGYDISTPRSYELTMNQFDEIVGINRLVGIHINDSKHALGSHKDRHAHIGYGQIGVKAFELILNDERLKHLPKILETPKEDDWDRKNLRLLWEIVGQKPPVEI